MNEKDNPIKANPINPQNTNFILKPKNVPPDQEGEPFLVNDFKDVKEQIGDTENQLNESKKQEVINYVNNLPENPYQVDQLIKGILVEFEHTENIDEALEIAKTHLDENVAYYNDTLFIEDLEKYGFNNTVLTPSTQTQQPLQEKKKVISFKEYLKSKKEFRFKLKEDTEIKEITDTILTKVPKYHNCSVYQLDNGFSVESWNPPVKKICNNIDEVSKAIREIFATEMEPERKY